MFKRRKEHTESKPSSQDLFNAMRLMTFEAAQNGTIPQRATHPDVYGLLVDVGQTPGKPPGYMAVAALGDNTARWYFDNAPMLQREGPVVAVAIQKLLETVQTRLNSFAAGDTGGLPGVGTVRFHVLTKGTGRFTDVSTDAFWGRADHSLMPVIMATQEVIYTIRTGSAP